MIVIDQSDDNATGQRLGAIPHQGELRYHRTRSRGVGPALQEGFEAARSPYILRTDDDCEVSPDWAAAMAKSLRDRHDVGVVFSNVVAAPFDPTTGYTPICERHQDEVIRSAFGTLRRRGLGAGVAYRREALEDIGGFDASLGPGCPLGATDDWDIELRVLLRNWLVFHNSAVEVVHHGYRSFAEGKIHARRDWYGIGALFAKLIRAGHPSVIPAAAWQLVAYGILPPINDVIHLRRPRGIGRVAAFFRGFGAALRVRIDRRTMRFVGLQTPDGPIESGDASGHQPKSLPEVHG